MAGDKADVQLPSERKFGVVFVIVFALVGAFGLYHDWRPVAVQAWFAGAGVFAAFTLFAPRALAPLNRLWYRFGELLGRIVSPIVLGAIFFLIITPVALIGRVAGRDELRLKRRQVASYWVERDPPGPAPDSFKNQF